MNKNVPHINKKATQTKHHVGSDFGLNFVGQYVVPVCARLYINAIHLFSFISITFISIIRLKVAINLSIC